MKRLSYFICSIIIASVVCIQGTAFGERGCVLIASSESAFKAAVVRQIVKELTQQDLSVTVVKLKDLKDQSEADYNCVILINSCWAQRLNRHVRRFLKRVEEKEKVVLLTTLADKNWGPKNVDVDAITAASRIQDVDSVARMLVAKGMKQIKEKE